MSLQHYAQSFSQGQITIPKSFRTQLGLGDKFWLKMILDQNKIILEPAETPINNEEYQKRLLSVKGDWFDEKEWLKNRKALANRYKNLP